MGRYNEPIATTPVPFSNTLLPLVGSETLVGFDNVAYGIKEYVYRRRGEPVSWKIYLSGPATTWIDITATYNSGSDILNNGPATTTNPPTITDASWLAQQGWTKRSLGQLEMEAGGVSNSVPLYWLKFVLDSAPDYPILNSIFRFRAKQYGNTNTSGMIVNNRETILKESLFFRGPKSGSGDRNISLVNLTTGKSANLAIPATTLQGESIAYEGLDLMYSQGDKLGVIALNGGADYSDTLLSVF